MLYLSNILLIIVFDDAINYCVNLCFIFSYFFQEFN